MQKRQGDLELSIMSTYLHYDCTRDHVVSMERTRIGENLLTETHMGNRHDSGLPLQTVINKLQ